MGLNGTKSAFLRISELIVGGDVSRGEVSVSELVLEHSMHHRVLHVEAKPVVASFRDDFGDVHLATVLPQDALGLGNRASNV